MTKQVQQLDRVIIRFAGDSGDGMQLTGDRFTQETASFGNDLSTLPNFPAEIRAPQGTLPGVSSFQVHFADHDILTPGDSPDVLVAMNPAALKANLADLKKGATVIVDSHDFTTRNLDKAGYTQSPLDDDSLDEYDVHAFELTDMTVEAVKEFGLSRKDASRAKNMFALGLLSWMYGRPTESTIAFLERRFAKAPDIRDANVTAFNAGWNFGETTEAFVVQYEIKPAPMKTGHLPQHHRQPGAVLRPDRRRPPSPGCRCSSGPTRSPRPPTSCTSSASTSGSASPRSRPRTRSPASVPPSAPRSAARSGSPPPPARASRSSPRRSASP